MPSAARVIPLHLAPAHHADPDAAATHAQTLDEGSLACREQSRHSWRSRRVIPRRWGYERLMKCRDCGAEHKQDLDRRARVVKKYPVSYPEGYLLPKGSGRLDADGKAAYRLELLKRGI